jgi:hypothetical protein
MWIQRSLSYVLTILQFPSPESSTCRLFLSFALSLAIAYRYDAVSLSICPMLRAKTTDITMQDILKSRRPRRHGISAERYIRSTSPDMPLSRRAVCSGYCHPFTILEGAVTHKLVNYWSLAAGLVEGKRRNEDKPFKTRTCRFSFPTTPC